MFYPSLVIAVLAAVVASQTMVTATFQVCRRSICLSTYWLSPVDLSIAPVTNHQALLLSSSQAGSHLESIPRPDIYTLGQLATDGRDNRCDSGLQQCM